MIGILIPLLILIPTALRAEDQIINPIYGPEIEMKNPILDWSATDMHELLDALKDYEAAKNRTPMTSEVIPVLPPAFTPAADST